MGSPGALLNSWALPVLFWALLGSPGVPMGSHGLSRCSSGLSLALAVLFWAVMGCPSALLGGTPYQTRKMLIQLPNRIRNRPYWRGMFPIFSLFARESPEDPRRAQESTEEHQRQRLAAAAAAAAAHGAQRPAPSTKHPAPSAQPSVWYLITYCTLENNW